MIGTVMKLRKLRIYSKFMNVELIGLYSWTWNPSKEAFINVFSY